MYFSGINTSSVDGGRFPTNTVRFAGRFFFMHPWQQKRDLSLESLELESSFFPFPWGVGLGWTRDWNFLRNAITLYVSPISQKRRDMKYPLGQCTHVYPISSNHVLLILIKPSTCIKTFTSLIKITNNFPRALYHIHIDSFPHVRSSVCSAICSFH